ncbi:hypothetical protein [Nitrospira sp. Nam80]
MAMSSRSFIAPVAICTWLSAASAFAIMIPDLAFDIPAERIQGILSTGLNHDISAIISYDIGFTKPAGYTISVTLQLTGFDPGLPVKQLWETDTERIRTGRDGVAKPILFDLLFSNQNPNHMEKPGPGRGAVNKWSVGWPSGIGNHNPWADEVGHFLGNYDEYPAHADSTTGAGTSVYDWYHGSGADWAASHSAPEPASFILVALGMITMLPLLAHIKRRLPR